MTYFKGILLGIFFNVYGLTCITCMKNKYFKEGYFVGLLMFTYFMIFTGFAIFNYYVLNFKNIQDYFDH